MTKYLLDTNHLSAYLDPKPALVERIDESMRAGNRFGICLPVLCEYRAGIRQGKRFRRNLVRLQAAMDVFRFWPTNEKTTVVYAEIFQELRSAGNIRTDFDMLIAAIARQHKLTLLTADRDFQPISGITIRNWL